MSASALFFAFGFTEHRFTPVTEEPFPRGDEDRWGGGRIVAPRRFYLHGAGLAVIGTLVLAWAPNVRVGVAGTFVARGLAWAAVS